MLKGKLLVNVCCLTYNHERYVRQCLDGLVMQRTNFVFEVLINDDASKDDTQKIIKEYECKYPNIIKPIYQSKNQYSQGISPLRDILTPRCTGKYIAICEGDDYWTDPYKLQKQVDFLESHKDYTMICSRAKLYSETKRCFIGENLCYYKDRDLRTKDIILKGGLYVPTCSILYRKEVINNYPIYCEDCNIGDYPLQIMCAMKGKVRYMHHDTCVYRVENPSSWCGKQKSVLSNGELANKLKEIKMLEGYMNDYPQYKKVFKERIVFFTNIHFISYLKNPAINDINKTYISHIVSLYNFFDRIGPSLQTIPIIRRIYDYFYFKKFNRNDTLYVS